MSNNTVWEYVIILSGLVVRRSGMEPMVLGSIPATKPVFFPSFFFRCWLIHSFFYCNIFYKIKTAATYTHRLPLSHSSLIVFLTSAWVRGFELQQMNFCFLFYSPPFFWPFVFVFILNFEPFVGPVRYCRSVFKKSVNFHPPRVSKWWTIIWLGIWLKTLVSICDVQTKPSFFLDFGIHHTCSFPPLHFSHFFYCNIFYKTRPVATCSHRLPFIQSWSLLLAYLFITDLWFCHLL